MLTIAIFLFALVAFIYVPGRLIVHFLRLQPKDLLIDLCLSLTLGLANFTLFALVRSSLRFPWLFLWVLPLVSLFLILKNSKKIHFLPKQVPRLTLVLILTSAVLQSLPLLPGGLKSTEGVILPGAHDSLWNIAISNELSATFPPGHPGFSGALLKNNHFYYPLFLAALKELTQIDLLTLYFQLAPLFVSGLFGLSLYTLSTLFFQSNNWRNLCVFLGYFCGNIAYLLVLFKGFTFDWRGNTFFADQPFDQLTNPYTVLGFAVILVAGYFLEQAFKNKNGGWLLAAALVLGPLYGFKSFAGVLGGGAFFFVLLIWLVKRYPLKSLILAMGLYLLLAVPTVVLISDPGKTGVNWAPGWILSQMMSSGEKLNQTDFLQKEQFYAGSGNALALVKLKGSALVIYLLGNLGVRILGIFYLLAQFYKLMRGKLANQKLIIYVYLTAIILSGLTLPLLFNLRGSPFNIIQFTPYALLLLVFPTVQFLGLVFSWLRNRGHKTLAFLLILMFVIFAIPVNVKNVIEKWNFQKRGRISYPLWEMADYLAKSSERNAVVFLNPADFYTEPAIAVAGLSGRRIYLSDRGFAAQALLDPTPREDIISRVFIEGDLNALPRETNYYLLVQYQTFSEKLSTRLADTEPVYANTVFALYKPTLGN